MLQIRIPVHSHWFLSFPDTPIHTLGDGEAADSGQVQQRIPGIVSSTSESKVEPRGAGQKSAKLNLK